MDFCFHPNQAGRGQDVPDVEDKSPVTQMSVNKPVVNMYFRMGSIHKLAVTLFR